MCFDVVTLFPELFEAPLRTSILGRAATTAQSQVALTDPSTLDKDLLERLGGASSNLMAFAIPMMIDGAPRLILYGDNHPGNRRLGNLRELQILIARAGELMTTLLREKQRGNTTQKS